MCNVVRQSNIKLCSTITRSLQNLMYEYTFAASKTPVFKKLRHDIYIYVYVYTVQYITIFVDSIQHYNNDNVRSVLT